MFMFWSKRTVLTRRLLKAKVRGEHETECETQEDTFSRINVPSPNNGSTTTATATTTTPTTTTTTGALGYESEIRTTRGQNRPVGSANRAASVANRFHQGCCGGDLSHDEDDDVHNQLHNHNYHQQQHQQQQQQQNNQPNRLTRCKELLKSLKENQLEMLLNVIESYGTDFGSCVLVPRKQMSPCRISPIKSNSPPASPGLAIPVKQQQQESTTVQCNRHQRYGLASSVHDNSSRRLPHRNILRSRRHHGGSRCSRCVSCHGPSDVERGPSREEFGCSTDDDFVIENRDNEMNLRVVDTTKSATSAFVLKDLRHDQPAWIAGERASASGPGTTTVGGVGQPGEACGSRPERDRCRRSCNKILRTATTKTTRKRRDSPTSGDQTIADSNVDDPLDDPHLLSCQIWRWPDLANSSELKKLPVCHSAKDPVYVCCNPYHWSRLCKPESPPPPYCLIPDRLRPEDRAPSENSRDYHRCGITTSSQPHSGSLTTNGEGDGEMGQKEWCTLAYWELGGRVGRLYPVEPATVNVFDSLHDGDGLCLSTLSENHAASPAVQRTRSKIGLGLMLSQESDGVWAYNRSDSPIFVNSPTLDDPESRTLLVYRVPPGFCLNIFDRAKTLQMVRESSQQSATTSCGSFNSGPVDVNSVRISFAKGWGPKYSRQEVTSCPCWLEVLLTPCR